MIVLELFVMKVLKEYFPLKKKEKKKFSTSNHLISSLSTRKRNAKNVIFFGTTVLIDQKIT
jgi:hypothetical protein